MNEKIFQTAVLIFLTSLAIIMLLNVVIVGRLPTKIPVCPETEPQVNLSKLIPIINNECVEDYGYVPAEICNLDYRGDINIPAFNMTNKEIEEMYNHTLTLKGYGEITCLNDDCTDYITTAESIIIPTFKGDFKTESNSDPDNIVGDGKGEEWPCEPDYTFLFDAKEYVYRSPDWFGNNRKGNAEEACKSKTPHLEHWFLTTEYPLSIAGHNQTQYRLLKCWVNECE